MYNLYKNSLSWHKIEKYKIHVIACHRICLSCGIWCFSLYASARLICVSEGQLSRCAGSSGPQPPQPCLLIRSCRLPLCSVCRSSRSVRISCFSRVCCLPCVHEQEPCMPDLRDGSAAQRGPRCCCSWLHTSKFRTRLRLAQQFCA